MLLTVKLYLVYRRNLVRLAILCITSLRETTHNLTSVDDLLNLTFREVGKANGFDFASL